MGSSAKRRSEKKKDFQKPKLKVGKAKAKAANHTDTTFSAKAIVINQQSLSVEAPSASHTFLHQVSLLGSRADSQRRDALAYLTNYISQTSGPQSLPITSSALFDKTCPLILDGTGSVRSQVSKLFLTIPPIEIRDHAGRLLPYMRAGMTHLSKDIRASTLDLFSWIMTVAGQDIVVCPGGWTKTLDCLCTLLGWKSTNSKDWSKGKVTLAGDIRMTVKTMHILAEFLAVGLANGTEQNHDTDIDQKSPSTFPLWHIQCHTLPSKPNAYAYLNLFSVQIDDDNQMLETGEERLRMFNVRYRIPVQAGIDIARKEGGELGRVAGLLSKAINST